MASSQPIRVFVTDIDGCLTTPYEPFDMSGLLELRRLAGLRRGDAGPRSPALTICSGRPQPYVEAVTQLLGIRMPALFEAGGGIFDPETRLTKWHPAVDAGLDARMDGIRKWMTANVLPGTYLSLDYGKRTQVSVNGPTRNEIEAALERVEQHVRISYADMMVAHTDVSIDVVPLAASKAEGLRWLSRELDIGIQEMAYIGDTNGDIEALRIAGRSFAPANATDSVKALVDVVTEGASIDGVLEAYLHCQQHH